MEIPKVGVSPAKFPPKMEEGKVKSNEGVHIEKNLQLLSEELFTSKEKKPFSAEKLSQLVERMNTIMEALSIEARFSLHKPTHTIVVTLVNRDTGEIVRQIPPEKLLDMVARLRELAGLFVDEVV